MLFKKELYSSSSFYLALSLTVLLGFVMASPAFAAHQNDDGDFVYKAELSGSAEVPAVSTDTTGHFSALVDENNNTAMFDLSVADGEAITQAHLHCGVEGENGPVVAFLFGNIPGGFDIDGPFASFTLTDDNIIDADCPTPITDIESLALAMEESEVYVNVHSVQNPMGEVRGQVMTVPQSDDGDNGTPQDADTNKDGFISTAEGVPFYGSIAKSLTTSGDVSPDSALALDRFPVANKKGNYTYNRTFALTDDIKDLEKTHIIVHGADIDNNGKYDGEKESSIAEGVPFEATVPVACGIIHHDKNNKYTAELSELNSTGVYGDASLKINGDEVQVKMKIKGASPMIAHAQHIHLGGANECPPNTIGVDQGDNGNDNNGTSTDNGDNDGDHGSENLIYNPGFEIIGSDGYPVDWFRGGWGDNTRHYELIMDENSGNHTAKVEISDYQNGDAKWYFKAVPVEGGKTYKFENSYSSNIPSEIGVFFTTPQGQRYQFLTLVDNTNGAWETMSKTITVPDDASEIKVFHTITEEGEMTVDDFSLVEVK